MTSPSHVAGLQAPLVTVPKCILTGERVGRRFTIINNGPTHFLQPAPYTVLLQLITARRNLPQGFVDTNRIVLCHGCTEYARTLVSRLNQQAGGIVETSWGQHRVVMQKDEIIVCKEVFDVPRGLIDKATLDALAASLTRDVAHKS